MPIRTTEELRAKVHSLRRTRPTTFQIVSLWSDLFIDLIDTVSDSVEAVPVAAAAQPAAGVPATAAVEPVAAPVVSAPPAAAPAAVAPAAPAPTAPAAPASGFFDSAAG